MKETTLFCLYTAGDTPNSKRAFANLTAVCQAHFAGESEIEVIDVLQQPQRASNDRVRVTPTLIVKTGAGQCRIVGTLSDPSAVLGALGLAAAAA